MAILKTTRHILENPWEPEINCVPLSVHKSSDVLVNPESLQIDQIQLWEQIYYNSGLLGLYVSYKPRAEFYLLTYNLFLSLETGYETFKGESGVESLVNKFATWGIDLQIFNLKY